MRKRTYARIARSVGRSGWGRRALLVVRRYATGFEWASVAFEALLMYLVISSLVVRAYAIPSGSMYPTLQKGDRIFVNKFIYRFRSPDYGDIVVFRTPKNIYNPEKPEYVKRVVGLPGNKVEIRHGPGQLWGHLYINGKPPPEGNKLGEIRYYSYVDKTGRTFPPTWVPEGEIYVFGDNSSRSSDSREWKGVPLQNLRGKAFFRFWPPHRIGPLE